MWRDQYNLDHQERLNMDSPKQNIKNSLETNILSIELDLKLARKNLISLKDETVIKQSVEMIDQIEANLLYLKDKLKLLEMMK